MKRYVVVLLIVLVTTMSRAQNVNIVNGSVYEPLPMEVLMMAARANAYRQEMAKQRFEEYKDKAYNYYNRGDYSGFIYYSTIALNTGWYNDKMYYDRGNAYEMLHEYRKAKKEYKRAIKKGYYPAQSAYEQCKRHQKIWKKTNK